MKAPGPTSLQALRLIRKDPSTATSLAKTMEVSVPRMTVIVQNLMRSGFIVEIGRIRPPGVRKPTVLWDITRKGSEAIGDIEPMQSPVSLPWPKTLTAEILGDPLPGRSAADMKRTS